MAKHFRVSSHLIDFKKRTWGYRFENSPGIMFGIIINPTAPALKLIFWRKALWVGRIPQMTKVDKQIEVQ